MIRVCLFLFAIATLVSFPGAAFAEPSPTSRWHPQDGDVIKFDVLRKGKPFGQHMVTFAASPDGKVIATTDVELKVKIGPITAFKYELDSTEIWRDGRLVSLRGELNDNGSRGSVEANAVDANMVVNGTVFSGSVPSPILPSSHWNFEQTNATSLLSTEDGEIIQVDVSELGADEVVVNGKTIAATKYRLDSDIDVDLWYDQTGRWVKLSFEARDQLIEYVLTELY